MQAGTRAASQRCTVIFRNRAEDPLVRRIRGEYSEMPGLRLTENQAMRLWALDRTTCRKVLAALVASHFLERDETGQFVRTHDGS